MSNTFDVIIVGGGPAGLFAAWWLADHSDLSVCIVERGNMVKKRGCPLGKAKKCMKCDPCHILSGMGGGGLFSDGKLNFIHKLGKTDLTQFMPRSEAESLIEETEAIFDRFGMTAPVFPSDMENAKSIRKEAKKHGIDLLLIRQKHLGSDCLPNHIDGMCEALRERGVSIRTGEDVRHVIVEDGEVRGLITDKGELRCRAAILAPGRVGADWMGDMAKKYGMELQQRGIEVGVRVETHNDVMSDLTNVIYDPTFFVQTQRYDDQTRTFCTNPAGFITLENYQDFVCVNGHAYRNRKSDNTNFAFLSKVILTDPVSDSHGYGVAIGRPASLIGGVLYGKFLGRKSPIFLTDEEPDAALVEQALAKSDHPSGALGIAIIFLPIMLIFFANILNAFLDPASSASRVVSFFGNTNIVLLITVFVAYFSLREHLPEPFDTVVSRGAESVGSILAIIGAGGAFGAVIGASGISTAIVDVMQSWSIPVILLGFLMSQCLRIGLGSITVSIVTASAVLAPVASQLGASPVLVGLAICCGGIGLGLPNDSGFWTICKMSGLSTKQAFLVYPIPTLISGLVGLAVLLILNMFASSLPGLM